MQKDSTILNTVNTLVCMSGMNDKEIEVVKCPHVTDFITITEGLHIRLRGYDYDATTDGFNTCTFPRYNSDP